MPPHIPGTITAANSRSATQRWKEADYKAQKNGERKTVFWVSGDQYRGEWHDNKRHGKGTLVYKNGDKYEGDWQQGLRHGLGTLWIFDDGKYRVKYNGYWENDLPAGNGLFWDDDNNMYDGQWLHGKKHGKGKMTYGGREVDGFGGDVYEGEWADDVKSGRGTMTYANGDIYEGYWMADAKHGPGTFYYMEKGRRFDGVWDEGTPKTGTYTAIEEAAASAPGGLPVIELLESNKVVQQSMMDALQRPPA